MILNLRLLLLTLYITRVTPNPLLDKKFREVQNPPSHADTKRATMSIADELSKLAKLKEQGVITEEEFSQMKRNLMEGMKDH